MLLEPVELAKGQLEVGFDLEGASQRARQALAALISKAKAAPAAVDEISPGGPEDDPMTPGVAPEEFA